MEKEIPHRVIDEFFRARNLLFLLKLQISNLDGLVLSRDPAISDAVKSHILRIHDTMSSLQEVVLRMEKANVSQ